MKRLISVLIIGAAVLTGLSVAVTGAFSDSEARGPVQLGSGPPAVFINAEYWTCPQEQIGALEQAADSIWGPLSDELVEEGRFLDWGTFVPIRALVFPMKEGKRSRQEATPQWDWVISWRAESEEAFTAAWSEFISRLQARFPDDPRPWRFCTDVTIVQYEVRGRQ